MAKHTGRRAPRRKKLFAPIVNNELALATLAKDALLASVLGASPGEEMWLKLARFTWTIKGITAGDGPWLVGVAHEDYSNAEIEEYLEAAAQWDIGDKIAQEQSARKIRVVGLLHGPGGTDVGEVLNNGNPIDTPLRFKVQEDQSLKIWVLNKGVTMTTGAILIVNGNVFMNRA